MMKKVNCPYCGATMEKDPKKILNHYEVCCQYKEHIKKIELEAKAYDERREKERKS